MVPSMHTTSSRILYLLLLLALLLPGCSDDGDNIFISGPTPPPGSALPPFSSLPGLNASITGVSGASGVDGSFQVGDIVSVSFEVESDAGDKLSLMDLDRGSIYVSGPTFNYQRVISAQGDVLSRAKPAGGGFVYAFAFPIPATYLAPLNDTPTFTIGELTGQPLLQGTYTVGLELRKDYMVGSDIVRDPANASFDFRFAGAAVIEPREVVTQANCNQCHSELRIHGDNRLDIVNCLLCHTAGSEDRNVPSAAGGTPNVTVDFKVLIHKLHSGANLPSVLGVTTNSDGSRNYGATPVPYEIVGFGNSVNDFSHVQFPVWPALSSPMPRDTGYSALSPTDQGKEDAMRSGAISCEKCHGDPDGAGPLPAPAQGNLIYTQPSRMACGSCHDDWVFDRPYVANLQSMPPQNDDSACTFCHAASGLPLDVMDAHLHPLVNPALTAGTRFEITSVDEAGVNDADGSIDPGEKIAITFTLQDDMGNDIDPSELARFEGDIAGPSSNSNLILATSIPSAALTGAQPYTINMPQLIHYEFMGDSTLSNGDVFMTSRTPHWNLPGAMTEIMVRTGVGASDTLAVDSTALQNYIDLNPGGGALFARDDFIVIEDGVLGQEEYLKVQWVDGDRLWFSSQTTRSYAPGLRVAHAAGASVAVASMVTKVEGVDYSLALPTGTITELIEFGDGNAVLALYITDFVMPSVFPGTHNESPGLGQDWGEWLGLPIVDGTYSVDIRAVRSVQFSVIGETTSYSDATPSTRHDFLVGSASSIQPDRIISSPDNCYKCHDDIQFHGGGRRGYEGCLQCHGVAGAEDRPRYVAANAPATSEVSIDFRNMLHKIHQGKDLAQASSYTVVGFGFGYPNNFSSHMYDQVGFPVTPGSTSDCESCHGVGSDSWQEPMPRQHPGGQDLFTRSWGIVCGSCHDSNSASAHIDINTSPTGAETCALCHGPDKDLAVELVHTPR